MPQFFPNSATLFIAELIRAELALSKLRLLVEGFQPAINTPRADLIANEAGYTGYTAGGESITAFLPALLNPAGGASIDWPTIQFDAATPYTVGEVIGGWWLETAAGDVIAVGTFGQGIPIGAAGQGFPFPGSLLFPNGF